MKDLTLFPQPPASVGQDASLWMSTFTARVRGSLNRLYDNYRGARVEDFTLATLPPVTDPRVIRVTDATSGPKHCIVVSGAWQPIVTTGTTVS